MILSILLVPSLSRVYSKENDKQELQNKTHETKKKASSSFCGLYCLYTVIKLSGKTIDFRELVKPEYLGYRGSSIMGLKQAAEMYGLYAAPISGFSSNALINCTSPVILHVKSEGSNKYDHYELFLGIRNKKALILDPPNNPLKILSFAEIEPFWDGNGLIISSQPIDLDAVFAPDRKRFVLYASLTIIAILILKWAKRFMPPTLFDTRFKKIGLSIAQSSGLIVTALLIGIVYHFVNDTGFLTNANATASFQEAHQGNFFPKLTEREVEQLLDTDTIFIDARLSHDFEAGHIESAISVPVNSTDEERHKIMTHISKEVRIVLYCQSSGCQFAEKVAKELKNDGFTNISIYKGGWADWTTKNSKKKET